MLIAPMNIHETALPSRTRLSYPVARDYKPIGLSSLRAPKRINFGLDPRAFVTITSHLARYFGQFREMLKISAPYTSAMGLVRCVVQYGLIVIKPEGS